jgi:hypothetical protein
MTWFQGAVRALVIVAYFVLFTVWLPSWFLHLSFVADAPSLVRDLSATAVWALFLVAAMWALRRAQRTGLI